LKREVSFTFSSARSVAGEGFRAAFRYPEATGSSSIVHLDRAHAGLIEQLRPGSSVLEIGCGGGQMRQPLAERGISHIGTDISDSRVNDRLRAHGGPDLLADAHFLPLDDDRFDFVYSAAVFEHLACPQLAAQEVARVLKPGGVFGGSVSFMEPWHDDSFYHMSPLGVYELLVQAGLTPEYIWPGYSGFSALYGMGNKATRALLPLASITAAAFRLGNRMRGRKRAIEDEAKVAGAINWIAHKA
jgi:SAM-dependent methyltransferase